MDDKTLSAHQSRPSCLCCPFLMAAPAALVTVGSIYIYYGYDSGLKDYYCTIQPGIPVMLVLWGITLVFSVLMCQCHHTAQRFMKYVYVLSPIFLILCFLMVFGVMPPGPSHSDSSLETYCPPFLYWFAAVSCIIGLIVYLTVVICIFCIGCCTGGLRSTEMSFKIDGGPA